MSQSDLAELRKRAPQIEANPVGVIVRQIIDSDPTGKPPMVAVRTALHEALIAAALADFRKDGKVRRLILDGTEAGGYELEPFGSRRRYESASG